MAELKAEIETALRAAVRALPDLPDMSAVDVALLAQAAAEAAWQYFSAPLPVNLLAPPPAHTPRRRP